MKTGMAGTWTNIHTGNKINVIDSKWISNPPIHVLVMDDNSCWQINDFMLHHQRINDDVHSPPTNATRIVVETEA